jgi:hypothetical protein
MPLWGHTAQSPSKPVGALNCYIATDDVGHGGGPVAEIYNVVLMLSYSLFTTSYRECDPGNGDDGLADLAARHAQRAETPNRG